MTEEQTNIEAAEGKAALDLLTADRVAETNEKVATKRQLWVAVVVAVVISTGATYVCTNVKAMHFGLDFLGHEGQSVGEFTTMLEKWEARALDAESKLEHKAWLDENWQIALGLIHDNSLCLERTKIRCGLEFKNWNPDLRGGFIDTAVAAHKIEVLQWITDQDCWRVAAGIKAKSILAALRLEQGEVAAR